MGTVGGEAARRTIPWKPMMSLRRATPSLGRAETDRLVNLGLAALLLSAVISGLASEATGTPAGRWLIVLHGVSGLGLLMLSRRKTRIATRALNRPRRRRGWTSSLLFATLVVIVVLTGLLESTGITYRLGPVTVMQVHIGGAVLAIPVAILHILRRPARPRATDLSRRTLLRAATVGAAAGVAWLGWEGVLNATSAPGATRRFTASHERGSGDPDAMPVTQWFDDAVQRIDPVTWRLHVGDRALTFDDLHRMPQEEITAILDCTSMWYAEQVWGGVRLDRLIDLGDAPSVAVRSATGYALRFPARDLDKIWLALEVGGRPLSAGHGFPARIVAPGRRGFWWVKWVTGIQPSSIPWWVQSPFPLT
jgi:DMSO/TMAO reductase YedYZ molybdopterin-dependent catalytic subunit